MPTIRETAESSVSKVCELPRIDWFLLLKSIPEQDELIIEQMRLDLLEGVKNVGNVDVVYIEAKQVLAMCELGTEE